MYRNGNFEARRAALCLLPTLALTVLLVIATGVLFFTPPAGQAAASRSTDGDLDWQQRAFVPGLERGQQAWQTSHGQSHSLGKPLRPGGRFETTWVFDVPAEAKNLRMFAGWYGFPSCLRIGDEASPRHGKTHFAL